MYTIIPPSLMRAMTQTPEPNRHDYLARLRWPRRLQFRRQTRPAATDCAPLTGQSQAARS